MPRLMQARFEILGISFYNGTKLNKSKSIRGSELVLLKTGTIIRKQRCVLNFQLRRWL